MKRKDDDGLQAPELLTEETFRLAEEMVERLPSKLSIDKRGKANFYNGAFTDLDSLAHREFSVTVADIEGQPWLTLISRGEVPKTANGLLVYNVPPREGRRYVGRTQASRPGRRQSDPTDEFFTVFDIVRDARR